MASKRKTLKTKYRKRTFLAKAWRRYEYKHTTAMVITVALFVLLLDTALVQALLIAVREAGLAGIFLSGALFVSFFTAAPAVVILVAFADNYNPFIIALLAGAGSMIGDFIILRLIRDDISYELKPLARKFGILPIIKLMQRKAFRPIAVLISALLIALPLPDELGLALLGTARLSTSRVLALTFVLNAAGILILVLGARSLVSA